MPPPLRVLETCIYAEDLDAAFAFYRDILELELHSRAKDRHVFFHCDRGMVLIFNPNETELSHPDEIPAHGSRGSEHICWAVERSDFEEWCQKLETAGVVIEHELTWENGARSIYFRDPAGNSLEFATPRLWENDPD